MKVKGFLYMLLLTFIFVAAGCTDDLTEDIPSRKGEKYDDDILMIGDNIDNPGYGALTYISADGTIESDVWEKVNGTKLPGSVKDLYVYNGKMYILCGKTTLADADGGLIVADARTFKKEKSFPINEMEFEKPEGTGAEYKPLLKTPTNVVVLNERNIFIKDAQGLFRFDSTTGVMKAVKGTYHIANAVNPNPDTGELGGNLESRVTSRGLVVSDNKLYITSAGFWKEITGVYEIAPDKDEVNRSLEIPLDLVSGLVEGGNNELYLASYTRGTTRQNMIHKIDITSFAVIDDIKATGISLAPGFFSRSGVSFFDSSLYLSEIKELETSVRQSMSLNRISVSTGDDYKVADFKKAVPNASRITTNPVAHGKNIYVSVCNDEGDDNHILIYDCSGDNATLVKDISGKTGMISGIYFMKNFY